MTKPSSTLLALSFFLAAAPAQAEKTTIADQKSLALTVYNDNLALVREVRQFSLEQGVRDLEFSDVAAEIDPTSVSLRSLSAPTSLQVLEQNFEYDLLTPEKLMEKYVGQEIELQIDRELTKATLLGTRDGLVYRIGDKIHLSPPGRVILPKVPDNLVAKPTLKWLLQHDQARVDQRIEASYLTRGLSWQANYVLVSQADGTKADLNGWVTLRNQSGASYPSAQLTLVAGDVNRVRPKHEMMDGDVRMPMVAAAEQGFAERALFEYHSYQLGRPTTLKDKQIKQISLLSGGNLLTKKLYRFESGVPVGYQDHEKHTQKVNVYLDLANTHQNHLGMPLPKGTVRVYQQDADQHLQFVGEDAIEHTPRDETLHLKLGQAFDLVGERKQTDFKVRSDRSETRQTEASYEVVLRNHKDQAVLISVVERVEGDWQLLRSSHPSTKTSASSLEFPLLVPAHQALTLTYTVRAKP